MIDNQVPTENEPKEPISKLYESISKDGYELPAFDVFKTDMENPESLKKLHDTLRTDGYDLPEFNQFSIDLGLKKKDIGQPFGNPSRDASRSELPSSSGVTETEDPIFKLLKQRQQILADKKNRPVLTAPADINFDDLFQKQLDDVDSKIKAKGFDPNEITGLFGNVSNLDISDEKLKKIYANRDSNPFEFNRNVAAANWQGQLYNAMFANFSETMTEEEAKKAATKKINSVIDLNRATTYEENKKNASAIKQEIYNYTAGNGELRKNIISNYAKDVSYGYGLNYSDKADVITKDPRSAKLNKYQIIGLDYLQNADEEKFANRSKMLSVSDEEKLANADNAQFNLGLQSISKEAEDMGMKLVENAAMERITRLEEKKKAGELTEGEVLGYNQAVDQINEINELKKAQRGKYPMAVGTQVDQIIQEATGSNNSMLKRFVLQTGEQVDNAATFIADLVTSPFMSNKSKNIRDIEDLGDKRFVQSEMTYAPGNESIVERDVNISFGADLKAEIDKINSSDMSDTEKIIARRNATFDMMDQVSISANPNAGKINVTAKTVLGATSAVASQMIPQIALAMVTGGGGNISKLRSLSSLFASTFATAYQPYYVEGLEKGVANPTEYATTRTFIEASTELIGDDLARVKKLFKGKGIAGDIAEKITDADWKSVTNKGLFQQFKDKVFTPVVKSSVTPAIQEGGEEVLSQVATNYLDDEDLTKGVKESFVTTAVGMFAMNLVGLPFSYKNVARNQKYTLYEAGSNAPAYIKQIDSDLADGNITSDEAARRKDVVTKMGTIIKNMVPQRNDGKLLTDNEKAEYAFNEFVKAQAAEGAKNVPAGTASKLNEIKTEADNTNDEILNNTKDQSIPTITASGKRLFNTPNPETAEISKEYKAQLGITIPEGEKIEALDEEYSKKIADAYDAMVNDPKNPEVKAAYEALSKETADQFSTISGKGYVFEIYEGKGEPYRNSEEMINDIRDNKHLFILSTENDFGQNKITEEQRNDNPLLKDSGVKDVNGKPLLMNDIFRGVHDFFGHSERGNGFGAVGEENAWDVHARMFTPLARRAMTAETRGQNSWVNFGKQMRDANGNLLKKGDKGYLSPKERAFAEQKIGLLPVEFSNIESASPVIEDTKSNATENKSAPIISNVEKALTATGVKVEVIENEAEFETKIGQQGVGGVFIAEDGTILINKESLNKAVNAGRIIFHEGAHPVMNIIRNTNKPLYDKVVAGLKEAAKTNKAIAASERWAQKNYEGEAIMDDEAIVETIAKIADGTLDPSTIPVGLKQDIIDFINAIAKVLGLPTISDTNIGAFKNVATQIATALREGKDISEIVGADNVGRTENNLESPEVFIAGEMNKGGQAFKLTTEPAVNIYESKEVSKLPVKTIEDVYKEYGGKATVINSDPTRVGDLTLPSGKKIFMYGGPGYLSIKENVDSAIGFATTQMSKVKSWSKYVSDLFGGSKGVTLIGTQAPTSMMANSYALRYVLDAISTLPKSVLKSKEFKDEFFGKDLVLLKDAFGEKGYTDFVNKYKKADLSDAAVIDGMISEMAYTVGDDNKPASFKARGAFVSNLLGGIALKSEIKGVEGDKGYVSKKPTKFIAKQLFDRLGLNQEKLFYELGEKSLVDLYMNEGKWGMAVAGFEANAESNIDNTQDGGVKHPLFNAKFPGSNAFILDGAYELDQLFTPVEMTSSGGNPYTKRASQMLAGSMYVKGGTEAQGQTFEYKTAKPAGPRIQARKSDDLVDQADLAKEMTEDGNGNYIFYHYSAKKLSTIDPNKFGANLQTGRDERPGVGISMYYTRPDRLERNVPNDFGYVTRVPKNEVYPFDADPLNLLPVAEKEFRKQYGKDAAFDANKQVAFVSKVAAARGYKMTVANWSIGGRKALRAQTTEPMKAEKYSNIKPGTLNQIEYNEEIAAYKPNAKKKIQTRVDDNADEQKDRSFSKTFDQRDPSTIAKISEDAKTYFVTSNKQTAEEVSTFMEDKDPESVLDYLLAEPKDIPGRVRIWMSGVVMDKIDEAIVAAEEAGDTDTVTRLTTKQADLINQISPLGTELGQAIQAFRRFYQNSKGSPAMLNYFTNNVVSKIEKALGRKLTEEELQTVKESAKKIQEAPEGLPKDEATFELSNYVGTITPLNAMDIAEAIWYAHILSGITTQSTNFFANFWNTFAEGTVTGIREAIKTRSLMPMVYGAKGFLGGLAIGARDGADVLMTGLTPQDADKYTNSNILEYMTWKNTKVGKLLGGKVGGVLDYAGGLSPKALKYVGRALAATDAAFSRANSEAISNMMAYTQALEEGKTQPNMDIKKRVSEILNKTSEKVADAQQQATDEGYSKGSRRFKRRVYQIIEQGREKEMLKEAAAYGKKVTLNYEPEGFMRPIYQLALGLQQSTKLTKMFLPFTRIVVNLTENSLNYTPAGFWKAARGTTSTDGGRRTLTKDERADFAIKASLGLATFVGLAALSGDDEDDLFDITANGSGNIVKNYELRKSGWRPYSIKLKSGRYISYKDWPIMPVLAALGAMHDHNKYSKENEPADDSVIAMQGMVNSLYDKSVMKGLQDFVEIFSPKQEYNQASKFGDRIVNWGADQAKSLAISNFTQQSIKFTGEYMDNPIKAAKGVERIYRDIPYLNDGLNPIIDVFGEPVTPSTSEKLLPITVGKPSKDMLLAVFNENGIFIGKPQTKDIFIGDDGDTRPMTDKEYYDYTKKAGQITKQLLIEEWDEVTDILKIKNKKERQAELQAFITNISNGAREEAMEMFYE